MTMTDTATDESNLVTYARAELERAGWFKKNDDLEGNPDGVYDGMIGGAVLDIIRLFADQGHSGMSAAVVTNLTEKLMRYEPLSPLTFERDEWTEVSDGTFQNRRKSTVFTTDFGVTWYDIDEPTPESNEGPFVLHAWPTNETTEGENNG